MIAAMVVGVKWVRVWVHYVVHKIVRYDKVDKLGKTEVASHLAALQTGLGLAEGEGPLAFSSASGLGIQEAWGLLRDAAVALVEGPGQDPRQGQDRTPVAGEGGEGGSEGTVMTTTKDKVDDFFGVEDDSGSGLFNEASLLPSAPWALK